MLASANSYLSEPAVSSRMKVITHQRHSQYSGRYDWVALATRFLIDSARRSS